MARIIAYFTLLRVEITSFHFEAEGVAAFNLYSSLWLLSFLALSLRKEMGVTHYAILWSPDFPPSLLSSKGDHVPPPTLIKDLF